MGNCNRCGRDTDAHFECPACNERFCERHRIPAAHECVAVRTSDGDAVEESAEGVTAGQSTAGQSTAGGVSDRESTGDTPAGDTPIGDGGDGPVDAPPTRLYPEEVDPHVEPDGSDPEGGETLAGMDFDPTGGISRLLRIAGVFTVVLFVGVVAAGLFWVTPGGGMLGLIGDTGPTAAPAPGDLNTTQVERLIHERTNGERRGAGVEPLAYDEELAAIGAYHSRDMGANDYASHTSPEGETIADRYRQFGYTCETIGEVLQWLEYDEVDWSGDPEEALARTVVANWMRSDLHRSFVLDGSWARQGVGVHVTDSGQVYVTQNTCGRA